MAVVNNIIFPGNGIATECTFDRFGTIPTADEIKNTYLFGIPFEDQFGETITDDAITHFILVAISEFEHQFNVTVNPAIHTEEKHDYYFSDYQYYNFIQLYHYPVQTIEQIQLRFSQDQPIITFPPEWTRLYPESGQVQITPNTAAISQFIIAGTGLLPRVFGARNEYPQLFYLDYTSGFEQNKIPFAVIHWLSLKAAIDLLSIAGDLAMGAGIQSTNIALEGLSQGIVTTKGGGLGAFGARVKLYQTFLERASDLVRNYYKGPRCTAC